MSQPASVSVLHELHVIRCKRAVRVWSQSICLTTCEVTSAEFKAKGSLFGGGVAGSFGRSQQAMTVRDPQSEEVFCNYHLVVMRKYGSYEDGSYEEMPNWLPDLRPHKWGRLNRVLIESYRAWIEPRQSLDRALIEPSFPSIYELQYVVNILCISVKAKKRIFSLVLFDGDCVLEHGLEQIPEGDTNEYIFARSKYLQLEIRPVMKLI
jgi:hypothetical protein